MRVVPVKVVIAKPILKNISILQDVLDMYDKYQNDRIVFENIQSLMTYWHFINTEKRFSLEWKKSMRSLRYIILNNIEKHDNVLFNNICRFMIPYIVRFQ